MRLHFKIISNALTSNFNRIFSNLDFFLSPMICYDLRLILLSFDFQLKMHKFSRQLRYKFFSRKSIAYFLSIFFDFTFSVLSNQMAFLSHMPWHE